MDNTNALVEASVITPENIEFYNLHGYLIAPDVFPPHEVAELKKETAAIFRGERGNVDGLLPVQPNESDIDVLKKYIAIHFPHKISKTILQNLSHPLIVDILKQIIGPNVKCMQSMLFVKGPGKKGQSWHQDEFYIPTRDRTLVGAWIAVDNASVDNGCLWIIPGKQSHLMRRIAYKGTEFADVDSVDVQAFEGKAFPVEVRAGSVVFFNGYTLHSSQANKTADNFRIALVNHYMSAESMLPWNQDGRLPATEDMRDIVMVAGQDPYDWKGLVDVSTPYLRPEVLKIKTDI